MEDPELLGCLESIKSSALDVKERLEPLIHRLPELHTFQGISLLEVKFHMLLNYLISLGYTALLKVAGKPLGESDVISSLIESRTVLEKLRPLELKLKYQIEKLVKQASLTQDLLLAGKVQSESQETLDPLAFKPNPDHLIASEKSIFFLFKNQGSQ